jgi:hypothetical protein
MGMSDSYFYTNQLEMICEKIRIRTYDCEQNVNLVWFVKKED